MAEAKEDWKRWSFWITPSAVIGFGALIVTLGGIIISLIIDQTNLITTASDNIRDDLRAQIFQTETRLNARIGSLKEDVVENRNKIDVLETKVDRILGHLTGPGDGNGK